MEGHYGSGYGGGFRRRLLNVARDWWRGADYADLLGSIAVSPVRGAGAIASADRAYFRKFCTGHSGGRTNIFRRARQEGHDECASWLDRAGKYRHGAHRGPPVLPWERRLDGARE